MRKLVIPRELWIRGESSPLGPSLLLAVAGTRWRPTEDVEGGRCCVGHYLRLCGVPDAKLEGLGAADDVDDTHLPEETRWLLGTLGEDPPLKVLGRSKDAQILYSMNDAYLGVESEWTVDSEASRERRIAEVFARHGVEVEFTGEGPTKDPGTTRASTSSDG